MLVVTICDRHGTGTTVRSTTKTTLTEVYLQLSWSSSLPEKSLKQIGEFVGKSTLKNLEVFPDCSSCELSEEDFLKSVVIGVKSHVRSLTHSCVDAVSITVTSRYCIPVKNRTHSSLQLQDAVKSVNIERKKKSFPSLMVQLYFYPCWPYTIKHLYVVISGQLS